MFMFRFKKAARRLSDWLLRGSAGQTIGLAEGIIDMQLPAIVATPPGAVLHAARATTAWERARGAQQARSRLRSVVGDSEDAEETRRVDDAIMQMPLDEIRLISATHAHGRFRR
jgi:hypothetical protein